MATKPKKKIRPVAKGKKKNSSLHRHLKGETVRRYETPEEMLVHVQGYMPNVKIVKVGIEHRQFGIIDHTVFYYLIRPKEEGLVPGYGYQIYNNGIPRAGGTISGA